MSIVLEQGKLAHALRSAASVADPRSEILKNVRIRAIEQTLYVMATDTVIGLTEEILLEKAAEMDATVNASRLSKVVDALPAGPIELSVPKSGQLHLKSGRSEFRLLTVPPGDFPDVPYPDVDMMQDIDSGAFLVAIDSVIHSVSTDAARLNLVCALFESNGNGNVDVVSTDGHRLTVFTTSGMGKKFADECRRETIMLIPRKALLELRKIMAPKEIGQMQFCLDGAKLWFQVMNTTLYVKIPEVPFPPWKQVLPKKAKSTVIVDRVEMTGAIRRAVILAPSKTALLVISIKDDELSIRSDNADLGTSVQTVAAEYDGEGEEFRIGLNGNYLVDALSVISTERVAMELTDEIGPVLVRPESSENLGTNLRSIVMPMRI